VSRLRYEWDQEKARANQRKHNVSFEEAVTVFLDPLSLDPSRHAAKVTRDIAARLAELARSLEARGIEPKRAQRKLGQLVSGQCPECHDPHR
jgi:hypothetical protein